MTESERRDQVFMRTAFSWLKEDADLRMHDVRTNLRMDAGIMLMLLWASFFLPQRKPGKPEHTVEPTTIR